MNNKQNNLQFRYLRFANYFLWWVRRQWPKWIYHANWCKNVVNPSHCS